jgi:Spy/CpxP family protein refolding chaperone
MDKNGVYLSIFAVLCVLAGVLVGASITKGPRMPFGGEGRMDFRRNAEHFMRGGHDRHEWGMGEGPLEMLTMKLSLSPDQKTKVEQILEKTRQEIDEVGKNVRTSLDQIREKSDKEITTILTPQQQERFKALQKEFAQGHHRFMGPRPEDGPMGNPGGPSDEHFPPPGDDRPND